MRAGHPAYDEVARRHHEAVESGVDSYVDPVSGFRVFTTRHHLERGVCCESRCRHCPFGFDPA